MLHGTIAWACSTCPETGPANCGVAGAGPGAGSSDGGATFSKIGSVQQAGAVGFGKAAPGSARQTLYLIGTVNGVTGIFRSVDGGTAWTRINDDRTQFGGTVGGVITGDPDVYGRVYAGSNGRGVLIGEPS